MDICIWCKQSNRAKSIEHIIPEAMGCPENFVLKNGEVCQSCNNKLGILDQSVINAFDLTIFMADIPRKRGKKPTVNSRGNMIAQWINGEQYISINMDPISVTLPWGTRVGPYGKSARNVSATFKKDRGLAKISFQLTIGDDPKFIRGIYKIAFESIAYFLGPRELLNPWSDEIRRFVLNGEGQRRLVMLSPQEIRYHHRIDPPLRQIDSSGYVMRMQLAYVNFLADLTDDGSAIAKICRELKRLFGNKGWTCLPLQH